MNSSRSFVTTGDDSAPPGRPRTRHRCRTWDRAHGRWPRRRRLPPRCPGHGPQSAGDLAAADKRAPAREQWRYPQTATANPGRARPPRRFGASPARPGTRCPPRPCARRSWPPRGWSPTSARRQRRVGKYRRLPLPTLASAKVAVRVAPARGATVTRSRSRWVDTITSLVPATTIRTLPLNGVVAGSKSHARLTGRRSRPRGADDAHGVRPRSLRSRRQCARAHMPCLPPPCTMRSAPPVGPPASGKTCVPVGMPADGAAHRRVGSPRQQRSASARLPVLAADPAGPVPIPGRPAPGSRRATPTRWRCRPRRPDTAREWNGTWYGVGMPLQIVPRVPERAVGSPGDHAVRALRSRSRQRRGDIATPRSTGRRKYPAAARLSSTWRSLAPMGHFPHVLGRGALGRRLMSWT